MGIKLQLIRDGKVIFEIPLTEEPDFAFIIRKEIEDLRREIEELTELYSTLSSRKRADMLMDFFKEDDWTKRFSDFVTEYGMNPKVVWDNLKKMQEANLVTRKGEAYRLSPIGVGSFLTACIVLRRVLSELEKYTSGKEYTEL